MFRRALTTLVVCISALGGMFARADDRVSRIDAALTSAARFLVARQKVDGTWRSNRYRSFDDGSPLTPHVLSTLMFLPQDDATAVACQRALALLQGSVDDAGALREPFASMPYPSYTAAEIAWCIALASPPVDETERRVRDAWTAYIRQRQFGEELGWQPSDPPFGGWGYGPFVPRRPDPDDPFQPAAAPNLSATLFSIGALRFAHVPPDDPVWRDALIFVERCQNFGQAPGGGDEAFDDGGFFFSPIDAAGNKAGVAGVDAEGRQRFASYGSMTADGVRALLQCGLPQDHPRVLAARGWLERNFSAAANPGRFPPDREILREATYYYYAWSAAHGLSRLKLREIASDDGPAEWFTALADVLLSRQSDDGSWTNRFTDSREDDPLVATPFAAAALAICRERMAEAQAP